MNSISERFISELCQDCQHKQPQGELSVGRHNSIPDEEFDQEQLEKGIEVEKEHTDDLELAEAIAKDHLSELPDYYSRLDEMEEEGKKEHSSE